MAPGRIYWGIETGEDRQTFHKLFDASIAIAGFQIIGIRYTGLMGARFLC